MCRCCARAGMNTRAFGKPHLIEIWYCLVDMELKHPKEKVTVKQFMKDDWSAARRCVTSHPLHGAHLQDKYVEVCLHSWCNAGTSSHSTYCCVFGITTSISGHLNRSCPGKRGVTWTQFPAAIQNSMEVSVLSELLRCNLWRRRHFINPHRLAGEIGGGRKPSVSAVFFAEWHKTICFVLRKMDVVGVASWWGSVSRLWLSFCLACASLFVSLVPPVLVNWDMLDDHCYKAFIAKFAAKGFSLGLHYRCGHV